MLLPLVTANIKSGSSGLKCTNALNVNAGVWGVCLATVQSDEVVKLNNKPTT